MAVLIGREFGGRGLEFFGIVLTDISIRSHIILPTSYVSFEMSSLLLSELFVGICENMLTLPLSMDDTHSRFCNRVLSVLLSMSLQYNAVKFAPTGAPVAMMHCH